MCTHEDGVRKVGIVMSQKSLAVWLKAVIVGMAICGLLVFGYAVPYGSNSILGEVAELWGAVTYIWGMAVPCYIVLVFAWKVATNIGNDNSFSQDNAICFKWIAFMSGIDTMLLFVGNVILFVLDLNSAVIGLFSFLICFIGVAISVASAVMSHLVMKAATLQEQSELTI